MRAFGYNLGVAVLAAAVSLFFFSPRLPVFTAEAPGSYEWTRGLNYLDQVKADGEQVEPALRHRLLPVFVARMLGLYGYAAFSLGWAGVIALLVYVQTLIQAAGLPRVVAIWTALLVASTSAVITSFGWLGIFDCWWVLGLVVIAFSPHPLVVAASAFLAPWVDERFLLGIPVALAARGLVYPLGRTALLRHVFALACGVTPYLLWRLYSAAALPSDASSQFLTPAFLAWLRNVPLGWWMAYRLGWATIAICFVLPNSSGIRPWLLGGACVLSVCPAVITAADISRSAMVVAPLLVAGIILCWRQSRLQTEQWLPCLAASNFLVPFIHVVYNKLEPVHPLPWEFIRLLKKLAG